MKKKILRAIQFLLIILVIVSSYKIVEYIKANKEFQKKDVEIKSTVKKWQDEVQKERVEDEDPNLKGHNAKEDLDKMESSKIAYLKKDYPNIIAWIKIPETGIDLPVVQGKDNIFYLDHDYKGNYDVFGTVFMEMANSPNFDDQNTILYGHNVRSGKVFHALHQYRDPNFVTKAPIIEVSNLKGLYRYKIFAAYIANPDDNFRTPNYGEEDFPIFYQRMVDKNLLNEELPTNFDKILTLQTCSDKNKRLIIHGIKIDD
ncbi:MAG: class B sortase [Tissierellia bacterium]|nr:class B sortase [Tissierellia bacterium]